MYAPRSVRRSDFDWRTFRHVDQSLKVAFTHVVYKVSSSIACIAYAEAEADVTKRQPRNTEAVTPTAVHAHAFEANVMHL